MDISLWRDALKDSPCREPMFQSIDNTAASKSDCLPLRLKKNVEALPFRGHGSEFEKPIPNNVNVYEAD